METVLILSHFSVKEGPRIFLIAPQNVKTEDFEKIPQIMDIYEEGFFIHMFGEYTSGNYIFNIANPYVRGKKEILLLSLILEKKSNIDMSFSRELLESFAKELNETEEAFKVLHFNPDQYEDYEDKLSEIKSAFFSFFKNLQPTLKALSVAEAKYKALYDNALVCMISTTLDGRPITINDLALSTLGYSSKEDYIENFNATIHWVNPSERLQVIEKLQQTGEIRSYQGLLKSKEGKEFWGEMYFKFFPEEKRIDIAFIDVSKRKQMLEMVKDSEEKFRHLFESSPFLIILMNKNGIIIDVNIITKDFMNLTKEELVGKNFRALEFLSEPDLKFFEESIEEFFKKGYSEIKDLKIKRFKDQRVIWINLQATLLKLKGEPIVQLLIQNVSEQKEMELKLTESERKYRLITENSNDLIRVIEESFKIEYINELTHLRLTGYAKDDLVGKNIGKFIHPDESNDFTNHLKTVLKNGEGTREGRLKNKNGIWRWYHISSKMFNDADGNRKMLNVLRDITDRKRAEERLKESEEKYRLISENANDVICILDDKFQVEYVNEQASLRILGYSTNETLGRNVVNFIIPEDLENTLKKFKEGIKNGSATGEFRFLHKNGGYVWLDLKGRTFKNEMDEIKAIIVGRDITERKKIEIKIKESEEHYRFISENANDLISITDGNLKFEYINEVTLKKVLGYEKEEIIGKNCIKFLHPDDRAQFIKEGQTILTKGDAFCIGRLRHKNGSYIWVEFNMKLIYDENKKPKFLSITRNVNERIITEQKLKEVEEKFRIIAEQSVVGVFILQENKIKFFNPQFAEMFGYTVEELKQRPPSDFIAGIHSEDREKINEKMRILELGKKIDVVNRFEFRGIKKAGEIIWLDAFAKSIEYMGKPAFLTIIIDITAKREAEAKLLESEEKYRDAYNRANFYKDLFAHDINNILNNIHMALQIASMDSIDTKKAKEMFDIVKEQTQRGIRLISNVQKLSKLEESKIVAESISVSEYVQDAIDLTIKSFPFKKIDFNIEGLLKESVLIQANPLISDVFQNLLFNAVNYNDNSTAEIKIKASNLEKENKKFLKIEFLDNGVGIPDEKKATIFQRAYREDKSVRGMGIGLSLVKKIINSYGGEIRVEDKVKGDHTKGSNFILLVPLTN